MKQCENCDTEVTFWMMQKQFTPFRYKCSSCNAQYRIDTPGMPLVLVAEFLIVVAMALLLGFGGETFGLVFVVPFVVVILCVGFGVEVWVQKYIAKNGTFTRVDGDAHATVEVPEAVVENEVEATTEEVAEPEVEVEPEPEQPAVDDARGQDAEDAEEEIPN